MHRAVTRMCFGLVLAVVLLESGFAQTALSWEKVRARFEAANPTLRAGQIGVDESRAQEITAYLRPNPTVGLLADQINPFNGGHRTVRLALSCLWQISATCMSGGTSENCV